MGEDQLDDLELDGPIALRILKEIAWDFTLGVGGLGSVKSIIVLSTAAAIL